MYWTPGQLALATPEQLVEFAVYSEGPVARRLNAQLVTACEATLDALRGNAGSMANDRRRQRIRDEVERTVGRSLVEPAWCDAMGVGRRPLAEVLLWLSQRSRQDARTPG
jgi:hypothetical protein